MDTKGKKCARIITKCLWFFNKNLMKLSERSIMATTSLETIQAIEAEAQAILASYQNQIKDLENKLQSDLTALAQVYDQETEAAVANLQKEASAEIEALRQKNDVLIDSNQKALKAALTDQKETLVKEILDKVVNYYGH